MLIKNYLKAVGAGLLLVAGTSSASTIADAQIWEPTDGDVNIISTTPGAEYAVFEDLAGDGGGFITPVISFIPAPIGEFSFTPNANPGDWDLLVLTGDPSTPANNSGTLLGSDAFKLAWWDGASWVGESAIVHKGGSVYDIIFGDISNGATTLTVDVNPIPIPAAAWLFGSAIIGLVGVARRKKAA